jgi:hypothetical protein
MRNRAMVNQSSRYCTTRQEKVCQGLEYKLAALEIPEMATYQEPHVEAEEGHEEQHEEAQRAQLCAGEAEPESRAQLGAQTIEHLEPFHVRVLETHEEGQHVEAKVVLVVFARPCTRWSVGRANVPWHESNSVRRRKRRMMMYDTRTPNPNWFLFMPKSLVVSSAPAVVGVVVLAIVYTGPMKNSTHPAGINNSTSCQRVQGARQPGRRAHK